MLKSADKDIVMEIQRSACSLLVALLFACNASATSVASLTFEELTDHSELIVSGQITRSWADWDSEHKFIWTHYELSVSSVQKGAPGATVELSEPGGVVGDRGMAIAGSVQYSPGDQVAVFLERMPNGYLRTTGWGQGKFAVDQTGHLHADASLRGIEVVKADQGGKSNPAAETSLRTLDGITIGELRARVMARVAAQRQGSGK
jgi:hypothetical protein